MKPGIVFFDFDGVIVDSFAAAFAVNKLIHPLITEEIYRKRFEGNINDSAEEESLKETRNNHVDFFAEYEPRLMQCPVFPTTKDVIASASKDRVLIIISSTTTDLIEKFLALHGIGDHFAEVMGNDVHKSKIAKIGMALARYGADAPDCVFITDTLGDIKEAHHMNVPTIAVTWGYQSGETLGKGAPSSIVSTPKELMQALA